MGMPKKVKRLFEQFQPQQYDLTLDIDKSGLKFAGTVTIVGKKVDRPSKRISLHQKDLKITSATLQKTEKSGPKEFPLSRINTHASAHEVRLHSDQMLYPGFYTITLEFSGTVTDQMHGMYPCYFTHEGKDDYLLATQFESHHAREVFPCVDEPEAKATFNLELLTPLSETVLSNTPIKDQSVKGTQHQTSFETTPIMSPYLLAFVCGNMHSVAAKTKDGIEVRTWASAAQPQKFLQYANDEAVKILEFFSDYFQTPFPLPKLDQVALPDFEAGAMENWGLITYREVALLADPDNRSQSSEQYVSMVIGHELSHQWFGDLVTMKWWDDLWLNESFASLMEHISLDALHPDWFQWEQYTAIDVIVSSNRDIYKDVQSVRVDVMHPDEIHTLFDGAIVYAKGGRLLKMMREYIGDEAFRAGLKTYFEKFAYKNTVREDLWQELTATSGKDIHALMNPWLEQSGMPQLDVERTKEGFQLSQKRFILDADQDPQLWPIPLLTDQDLSFNLLTKKSDFIAVKNSEPRVFNAQGSGHMVVRYVDEASREFVEHAVATQSIPPQSRINILNDYILLARRGSLSIIEALEIIERAAGEPREAVWQQIARVVGTLSNLTEGDTQMEAALDTLRLGLSRDWYDKLGWDDNEQDDPNTKALRQTMLALQVHGEAKDALAEAKRRFHSVKSAEELPAEQRGLIMASVVRSGEDVIDDLMQHYQTTANADLQHALSGALTATKDPKVAAHIIDKALGPKGFVRQQDTFRWFAYLMRNHHTREVAWQWLTSSWDRLEKTYGGSKSFDYFVLYSASPLNTAQWQKRFEEFFKPKTSIVVLKRNIQVALAEIPARVAWRTREEPKIKAYFKAKK